MTDHQIPILYNGTQRGAEREIRVQIEDQGRSQERTDRNIVNPPQCRPAAGPGEVRVSGSETDETSQGFKELATTNTKSKDDGSSNPNPLQWRHQRGTEGEIRVQIEDQGRSQERTTDRNIVNPPQCRPAPGPGEVRVSGSESCLLYTSPSPRD